MNYMAYDLPSESLWDDTAATLSHESSLRQSTLAAAAVEPLWPFLAAAETPEEFRDRLAMSQPNLEHMIVTSLETEDPSSYVREISGDFTQRFHQRMAERRATDKIADRLKTAGSYRDDPEMKAWYKARENVTYTDGTRVSEGDHIRYHQAPGGLMSPGDWRYGVAAYLPKDRNDLAANELHLLDDNGHYYGLYSHVIERADDTKTSAKSDSCPECGSHMSDVTIKGDTLSAKCDNCGWKGTKNRPKTSAKTAWKDSGSGAATWWCPDCLYEFDNGNTPATHAPKCPKCGAVGAPNNPGLDGATGAKHAAASGWLDAARKVVSGNTYAKVDGILLDQFSASAMVQVYDSLSPDNQAKFAAMSLQAAHDLTFKMLAKQGSKTAAKGPLPEHLKEFWGNSTKDPRDDSGYCPKQSRKTPAIPWHNGSRTCLSCGKDMTKKGAKQADRTGPAPDSPDGYEYTPAPDWVQRACRRRFEGGGVTALDPKNPGHYLHGVGNWWDGPNEIKDNGDHTLSFTSPHDNQTDRFDENGYFDPQGQHQSYTASVKTATRYCPTHKVYVGEGNQENHDHCPVETRKKKDASLEDLGQSISRLEQMTSGFFRDDDAQRPQPSKGQPSMIDRMQYRNAPQAPTDPLDSKKQDDESTDPVDSSQSSSTAGRHRAVNESADGAARYQSLPGVPTPAWIHDAWDLGKATQEDLDQGRADATPSDPFADSLTTTKDTRSFPHSPTASRVPVDLGRVRQSALRLADVEDKPVDEPAVEDNLEGTQQPSGYDSPTTEQPKTSKPRQMPSDGGNQNLVTVQQDIIPAPVQPDPFGDQGFGDQGVQDQMGGGGGFDMGYAPQQDPMVPSTDQMVAAKVASLASRVRMDNPDLSPAQARAIAAQTVATYPEMIKG